MVTSALVPPRLHARTVEIDDPGQLLGLLPSGEGLAWLRDGEGMVAWGEAARHKPTSVADASAWWRDLLGSVVTVSDLAPAPAGAGFMAFGSFVFDPANSTGQSSLVVPETIVGRRQGRAWVTRIGTTFQHGSGDLRPATPPQPPRGVASVDGGLDAAAWQGAVREAIRRIGEGRLDKVVLAREVLAQAAGDIDARWLAARLAAGYGRCWTYVVDGLVGSTPEMLIRLEGGMATSRVLAGTISRSGDNRHDLALAAALAQSGKDREEHEYAVASVARSMAPFCSGMHLPDAPYVLALPNVWHLATDVTGVADRGASVLDLLAALHPSAAVCGTPTDQARRTIAELEQLDRDRYSGPVGWIDANGDGEWGIALRCGILDDADRSRMRLFAGCGVVAGSDPAAELAESDAKLQPMLEALGLRAQPAGARG